MLHQFSTWLGTISEAWGYQKLICVKLICFQRWKGGLNSSKLKSNIVKVSHKELGVKLCTPIQNFMAKIWFSVKVKNQKLSLQLHILPHSYAKQPLMSVSKLSVKSNIVLFLRLLIHFYSSEYNTNFAKSMKGERAPPAWLSDFEKVTIEWISYHCRANSRRRRHITLSSPNRKSKKYYSMLH